MGRKPSVCGLGELLPVSVVDHVQVKREERQFGDAYPCPQAPHSPLEVEDEVGHQRDCPEVEGDECRLSLRGWRTGGRGRETRCVVCVGGAGRLLTLRVNGDGMSDLTYVRSWLWQGDDTQQSGIGLSET